MINAFLEHWICFYAQKVLLICICHIKVPVSSIKPFVYLGLFLSGFIQYTSRGGSRISERVGGGHMYKGVCMWGLGLLILSHFVLNIP